MSASSLSELRPVPDDRLRRALDLVDEMRFDLSQLDAVVRALRAEVGAQRGRIRELEHEVAELREHIRRRGER